MLTFVMMFMVMFVLLMVVMLFLVSMLVFVAVMSNVIFRNLLNDFKLTVSSSGDVSYGDDLHGVSSHAFYDAYLLQFGNQSDDQQILIASHLNGRSQILPLE